MKARLLSSIVMMFVSELLRADAELPLLKEGLLEAHTKMVMNDKTTDSVMKLCSTREIDKSMKAAGDDIRKRNRCSEVTKRVSADSYSSEMHCDRDDSVTKTMITYQGDLSSHMELHTKTRQFEIVTIIDQRYVGSCPADMKPGEALMADGKKVNFGAQPSSQPPAKP